MIEKIYQLFKETKGVSTDTRQIVENTIFFALKGEKFDGNQFVPIAFEKGAKYAVITDSKYYIKGKTILVEDSLQTLQQLANFHRRQLKTKILALTGSNGKTTTKELIYRVLSKKYKTYSTQGNLNNHIGVPLTLLNIYDDYDFAVIEMGANHVGEIWDLCLIAEPDIGLITNIGTAHLGIFGSFENLLKTKLGLFEFVAQKNGRFYLNVNDSNLFKNIWHYTNKVSYGSYENAQIKLIEAHSPNYLSLKFQVNNQVFTTETKLVGKYNADNVLAAVAVGVDNGVEINKIIEAIESYEPTNNRSQLLKNENNTLILDMYNANPTSMQAAILNFHSSIFPDKFLILGDMLELGEFSEVKHQEIVDLVVSLGFKQVILVGNYFANCKNIEKFKVFTNVGALCEFLKQNPIKNKTILIKGSNGINLKQCIDYL